MSKPFWQSKTFWFNLVFGIIAVGGVVLHAIGYDEFQPSPETLETVGVLVAIVNIILRRWFTSTALR